MFCSFGVPCLPLAVDAVTMSSVYTATNLLKEIVICMIFKFKLCHHSPRLATLHNILLSYKLFYSPLYRRLSENWCRGTNAVLERDPEHPWSILWRLTHDKLKDYNIRFTSSKHHTTDSHLQERLEQPGQRYLNGSQPQLSHIAIFLRSAIFSIPRVTSPIWACAERVLQSSCACSGKMSVSSSSSSDGFFARRRKSKSRTHFSIGEDSFRHEEDLLRYSYLPNCLCPYPTNSSLM